MDLQTLGPGIEHRASVEPLDVATTLLLGRAWDAGHRVGEAAVVKIFIIDDGQYGMTLIVALDKENAIKKLAKLSEPRTAEGLQGPFDVQDGRWVITPGEPAGDTETGVIDG